MTLASTVSGLQSKRFLQSAAGGGPVGWELTVETRRGALSTYCRVGASEPEAAEWARRLPGVVRVVSARALFPPGRGPRR